ncbi:hypothetical protein IHQ71_08030 [Rhizobium sp. TH2]|uniref:TfuA-like protein n=1 Tax=Rhizobium sp. TH2 TaxID=2775403 RepID=UPI002157503A|nr:TfuA-like protein [Rhizobium sp. TH2]UVC10528.1 hypothetical protein IHQ71_08030 [Rhizobium sp. TH2]
MVEVVVFSGPTIGAAEARTYLDALYLPPVGQGDLVRAVLQHAPSAIAVIDGVFAQRPAVRHKEILWAIARGVRVYGAASMGAIRAAELYDCGMVGQGLVFRWYRRTSLADDADVAVAMAPPEFGSHALSEALIDMRMTLKKAERAGVIGRKLRILLEQSARSLHFIERTYATTLSVVGHDPGLKKDIHNLNNWLASGIVRQKKSDAIRLLTLLSLPDGPMYAPQKPVIFELTDAFAYDLKYSNLDGICSENLY